MKANKPLKEAILRAPESTEDNKQSQQEQLYHLGEKKSTKQPEHAPQDLVNESHRNRMESLHNLREMEYDVKKARERNKK